MSPKVFLFSGSFCSNMERISLAYSLLLSNGTLTLKMCNSEFQVKIFDVSFVYLELFHQPG